MVSITGSPTTRVPAVLTREEVGRVLEHLPGVYHRMGGILYGSGLRVMECVRLRIKDIDFGYRQITVRDGKGERPPDDAARPPRRILETAAYPRETFARQSLSLLLCYDLS